MPVEIEIAHQDTLGALDLVVDAGNRKTALLTFLQPVALQQFRVDQYQQLITGFGDIDDDQLQMHIDLRSRQTDARRFVHGFRHVLRQLANTRINAFHFGGNFFQTGIGKA